MITTAYHVEEKEISEQKNGQTVRTIHAPDGHPMTYTEACQMMLEESRNHPELHCPHCKTYLVVVPTKG